MTGRLVALVMAGLLLLATIAACADRAARSQGSSSPSAASTPPQAGPTPAAPAPSSPSTAPAPSIMILMPSAGSTFPRGTVKVAVAVEGFDIVNKQFRAPVLGEGHVHFYLDVKTLPTTHAKPTTGQYRSISGTTYTWTGVRPGRHTLAVQLVGNDHVPLRPPVKDEVSVTV